MRIGVEARHLVREAGGGTTYLQAILEHLPVDHPHEIVLFADIPGSRHPPELPDHSRLVIAPVWGASGQVGRNFMAPFWLHRVLPRVLAAEGVDVLWSPSGYMPRGIRVPTVVTIQDLAPFHPSERLENPCWPWYFRFETAHAIRNAAAILAPSQATRNDIARWFPGAVRRVTVVPLGGPAGVVESRELPEEWRALLPPEMQVILCVGAYQHRRNPRVVLEALSLLPGALQARVRLVLCGGCGGAGSRWRYWAGRHGVERLVVSLGHVDDLGLAALYRRAAVVVVPSTCEGFGLPVLEAMAYGAPVIVSNTSALPEVAGDAALLAPPSDAPAWAQALQQALTDEGVRERLVTAGLARARAFSWADTAARTLQAIESAAVCKG